MGETAKRIGLGALTGGASETTGAAKNALGGGSAPSTPDFTAAATEQAKQSKVDTSNPFSSSQWSQGPDGRWSQSTQLAGGLGQAATGLEGQAAGLAQPMDWSQFGQAQTGDQARDQAITSAYGQATSRLDPQFQQRGDALTAQLANQGLSAQDAAGSSALGQFGRDKNDAYSSAMANAIGQGTSAGDSAFRNNLAARQTAITDALRQRGQPMAELGQLQGLTAGGQGTGSAQGPNLLGAMGQSYEGDLQKFGTQQSGKNSQMAGMASLAPFLAASDERLKMNVERLSLEAVPGVPFASWEWRAEPGERHFGVIAQDLEKVRPDLVVTGADGYRMVDYGALLGPG